MGLNAATNLSLFIIVIKICSNSVYISLHGQFFYCYFNAIGCFFSMLLVFKDFDCF